MLHYFPSVPRNHLPDNECVKVARNSMNQATMVNEDGPFSCFGCNGPLVYRKSHKRTRYSMHKTTLFHVRGYFAHAQCTTANHCSGESRAHSTAKALLLAHPFHPLLFHCARSNCRKAYTKHVHQNRTPVNTCDPGGRDWKGEAPSIGDPPIPPNKTKRAHASPKRSPSEGPFSSESPRKFSANPSPTSRLRCSCSHSPLAPLALCTICSSVSWQLLHL